MLQSMNLFPETTGNSTSLYSTDGREQSAGRVFGIRRRSSRFNYFCNSFKAKQNYRCAYLLPVCEKNKDFLKKSDFSGRCGFYDCVFSMIEFICKRFCPEIISFLFILSLSNALYVNCVCCNS